MRAVVTRVTSASVTISGGMAGEIKSGLLILLGIKDSDGVREAEKLALKIIDLRIFEEDGGKMNLSMEQIGGKILVVPQFTLLGTCKKGRRPEFTSAASSDTAIPLYEYFISFCRDAGISCGNRSLWSGYAGKILQRWSCYTYTGYGYTIKNLT